ncbi:MAG: glycosyltransferase [Nitrospinae bacterium]|nr:glycosyltransferase [Nitrospinota bacterium]
MKESSFDIICSTHLMWDLHLFQRPQQIMSRLSQRHKILYFAPVSILAYCKFKKVRKNRIVKVNENLTVFRPLVLPYGEEYPWIKELNKKIVIRFIKAFMKQNNFSNTFVLWLYTPLAYYLPGKLGEKAVVYDCMDDFKSFLGTPGYMETKEKEVVKAADIFFAGGETLLKNKGSNHKNATCFPCGVEVDHFGKAQDTSKPKPTDMQNITGKILGYYGAVDERIDYDLIHYLAKKNKNWSIVILGPIAKVKKPDFFDTTNNIHYLGSKDYKELPSYCAHFDVCLIPFKMNDPVTEHLNPTKTLEYLATGKPVISSNVPDIVKHFSDIVSIADNYDTFAKLVENELANPSEEKRLKGLEIVQGKSWDAMVKGMESIIEEHLLKK